MITNEIKNLKDRYQNGRDNIGRDFVLPCLKEAKLYRRGTGFFSSSVLKSYVEILDKVINGDLKIEILCSPVVQDKTLIDSLKKNTSEKDREETIRRLSDQIVLVAAGFAMSPEKVGYRSKLLSYLIATGKLEIKFAIPKDFDLLLQEGVEEEQERNLYHVKVGYFQFSEDEYVAFDGSFNESESGLMRHVDRTQVYKSWLPEDQRRVLGIREDIDNDWKGRNDFIKIYPVSKEALSKIKELSPKQKPIKKKIKADDNDGPSKNVVELDNNFPALPYEISGEKYELREHQKRALREWKDNDYAGVMALATGAGKTFTAIHGIVVLANAFNKLFAVVAVPYEILADQWCDVLRIFNINPIRAYKSKAIWQNQLDNEIGSFNLSREKEFRCVVVVNKTLGTQSFQGLIKRVKKNELFFIGDECHRHGSEAVIKKLPDARFKMGLSATPWSVSEEEKKILLEGYYGRVVSRYTIDEAIYKDHVLTEYEYHLHEINLTEEEFEEYSRLTKEYGKLRAILDDGGFVDKDMMNGILMARARVLGSAENKYIELEKLMMKQAPEPFTLIYCGDGSVESEEENSSIRDVSRATKILHNCGWRSSRFTADESAGARKRIMSNFKEKVIDALVAIRVLDEGFDLPSCRTAFLLASSRNERQFIQRRGRILRKSFGKEYAVIHDFLMIPPVRSGSTIESDLVEKELMRVGEFARVSSNSDEVNDKAEKIATEFGVSYADLKNSYVVYEGGVDE